MELSPRHHITNVVIFKSDDLLPDTGRFTDTGYTITDLYDTTPTDLTSARLYAAQMTASCFQVTLAEACTNFEIIIIPFVNPDNCDGRILAKKITGRYLAK